MEIFSTKADLATAIGDYRKRGSGIALVPTMGALHEGHLSLVRHAQNKQDCIVVSIFVNPTQFNDPADLKKYPRTPEKDLDLLLNEGVDLVFVPEVKEMYPEEDRRDFDLAGLDLVMEGEHRPGHFRGVAQIVSKLFEAVNPDRAYFGQKDFQQVVIIRQLVKVLELNLEIISCPIIRESDGLAMSSRNVRLGPKARLEAPFIFRTLTRARELRHSMDPAELKHWVENAFRERNGFQLEYFEIVDSMNLQTVRSWEDPGTKVACVAVFLDGIRLIDNLIFA